MDDKWFKKQQKAAGVTAEQIAQKMGRDRSVVSRIYNGRQKMSIDWAKAFAEVLNVPLDQVLKHAGALDKEDVQAIAIGFSEGDAVPWADRTGGGSKVTRDNGVAELFGGDKPGVDVWVVRSNALVLNGFLVGDRILVDTNQSETVRAGDHVIAQNYDWKSGSATTLIRRFEPPVLVSSGIDQSSQRVHIVDGKNVIIKGKIIASWRAA